MDIQDPLVSSRRDRLVSELAWNGWTRVAVPRPARGVVIGAAASIKRRAFPAVVQMCRPQMCHVLIETATGPERTGVSGCPAAPDRDTQTQAHLQPPPQHPPTPPLWWLNRPESQ